MTATSGALRHGLARVRSASYLRKWLILGTLIGVVAGLGALVFFEGLELATRLLLTDLGGYRPASTAGEGGFVQESGFARPWTIPLVVGLGGLVAGLIVFTWAPEAEGHGTDAAIHSVHSNPKGVRPRVIGIKLVASIITIGSGGSAGREGPTAQISSGFGSVMARVLNLTPRDARICVAAGIAAGIGAIFRAPLGGALLGVELLYIDDVEIDALIPSLVATVVGYGIFGAATGNFSPVFGDHSDLGIEHAWELLLFIVVGLAAGLLGRLYTSSFYWITAQFNRIRIPRAVKPALGGVVVGCIGVAVPGALGTGYGAVQTELDPDLLLTMPMWMVLVLPFAKILATGLSIGSGGSGGIFGPGLVIGGAGGALLWRLAHLIGLNADQQAFVIVGMAACFGAVAHAQVSVLLMVAEMTGSLALLPPAMVAVAFAALVVGQTTIYRSQLKRRSDSPAHRFGFGLPSAQTVPVTELMTPPRLLLPASLPVAEALARLQAAGLPGAPVITQEGSFLGSAQAPALARAVEEGRTGRAGLVGAVADAEAMTLPIEAGLDSALDALPASKGGWVPVLDDDSKVVGILGVSDVARGWRHTMRRSVAQLADSSRGTAVQDVTVMPQSRADNRAVRSLSLPVGAVVLAAQREGTFVYADPDHVLAAGDIVSILTRPDSNDDVRAIFTASAPD